MTLTVIVNLLKHEFGKQVIMITHVTILLSVLSLMGCSNAPDNQTMTNPVLYFEIPVHDMDRATEFYSKTLGFTFERVVIDGNEMALFPYSEGKEGATGALAKGDSYEPSLKGSRVYFVTSDIETTLKKITEAGGTMLFPKTDVGEFGFVAEFKDSEGNCIALHMRK